MTAHGRDGHLFLALLPWSMWNDFKNCSYYSLPSDVRRSHYEI